MDTKDKVNEEEVVAYINEGMRLLDDLERDNEHLVKEANAQQAESVGKLLRVRLQGEYLQKNYSVACTVIASSWGQDVLGRPLAQWSVLTQAVKKPNETHRDEDEVML